MAENREPADCSHEMEEAFRRADNASVGTYKPVAKWFDSLGDEDFERLEKELRIGDIIGP